MSETKRRYLTTEKAGYHVAGRKIPAVKIPAEGDGAEQLRPKVGHVLELTELEAKYELLSGSIVAEQAAKPAKLPVAKPAKAE